MAYKRQQGGYRQNQYQTGSTHYASKRYDDRPRDRGFLVHVHGDTPEALTKALRKLKKRMAVDGIMQDLNERKHYKKASQKKREAKQIGRKRWLKKRAMMLEND